MGTCTGTTSLCALAGYAMESRCHAGKVIEYDTVTNLSWTPDIRKHGIEQIVNNLLGKPWAPAEEVGREVPEAKEQEDCVVRACLSIARIACLTFSYNPIGVF